MRGTYLSYMYVPSIHLHVILSGSYFFWSFFLSGLRRHLCICPLRAPTDTNAFFHYLPASLFPFPSCFTSIVEEPYLSKKKKSFVDPFLYHVARTNMSSSIHVLYCSTASTVQRNQPAQSRKPSACRSECDNASKQRASTVLQYREHRTA